VPVRKGSEHDNGKEKDLSLLFKSNPYLHRTVYSTNYSFLPIYMQTSDRTVEVECGCPVIICHGVIIEADLP
jgi:hypothetical protein